MAHENNTFKCSGGKNCPWSEEGHSEWKQSGLRLTVMANSKRWEDRPAKQLIWVVHDDFMTFGGKWKHLSNKKSYPCVLHRLCGKASSRILFLAVILYNGDCKHVCFFVLRDPKKLLQIACKITFLTLSIWMVLSIGNLEPMRICSCSTCCTPIPSIAYTNLSPMWKTFYFLS